MQIAFYRLKAGTLCHLPRERRDFQVLMCLTQTHEMRVTGVKCFLMTSADGKEEKKKVNITQIAFLEG